MVPALGSARSQRHRAPRTDGFLEDVGSALLVITPDANVVTPDANVVTPDANVVTPVAIGAACVREKLEKGPPCLRALTVKATGGRPRCSRRRAGRHRPGARRHRPQAETQGRYAAGEGERRW
jgi:hypothetical protein